MFSIYLGLCRLKKQQKSPQNHPTLVKSTCVMRENSKKTAKQKGPQPETPVGGVRTLEADARPKFPSVRWSQLPASCRPVCTPQALERDFQSLQWLCCASWV